MTKTKRKAKNKWFLAGLLALSGSLAYSGTMGSQAVNPGTIYLGAFGGGGSLSSVDISQYGTAFFIEAVGGPLSVNGFGSSLSNSIGMVGGHVGFAWYNRLSERYSITPAVELEGYYVGKANIEGHEVNNDTIRLSEHDFLVNYPLKAGVFLVNAVLNADHSLFGTLSPYVGIGIGSAVVSVSGASAIQTSPAEPGINHYNSNPSDTTAAFAAQPKVGIHYDFSPEASVFAEYRFLYISRTNYTFGSTVDPSHVVTSPWLVNMSSQYYNMGTVGINFDV